MRIYCLSTRRSRGDTRYHHRWRDPEGGTMPLYEYDCLACGKRFEVLVRGPQAIACPSCGHDRVERAVSAFAVSSEGIRQANVDSARKRNINLEREKKRTEIDDPHRH
jgi:putative FmdB family regulatory protein